MLIIVWNINHFVGFFPCFPSFFWFYEKNTGIVFSNNFVMHTFS